MPQPILDARPTLGTFMRRSLLLLASCLFGAAACAPDSTPVRSIAPGEPSLIVNGAFDLTNTYANVGALIVKRKRDGQLFPECSGTLIAPTVFLTAGHCTSYVQSLPGADFAIGVSFANPIPWGDLTNGQSGFVLATSIATHPDYNQRQSDGADLGVVILPTQAGIPVAHLPTLNLLDELQAAHKIQSMPFTAVGYGIFARVVGGGTPFFLDYNPEPRQYAISSFNSLGPGYIRLSQNPAKGDGGTCYGDSGGPNFISVNGTLVIAATTVTGDANCRATNVDYRLDTPTARSFLGHYVSLP